MDVKTLCLGALACRDGSGYEIRKCFEEGPFAHFQDAGFGSIYPALKKLSEEGLITVLAPTPDDGRGDKKIYRITETGRQIFFKALQQRPAPDKLRSDVTFILFFAHLLPARHVARLLDDRIAWYQETIAAMERCNCPDKTDTPAGYRFVLGYGLAVYRASLAYLECERDTLLMALKADSPLPAPFPSPLAAAAAASPPLHTQKAPLP